MKIIKIENKKDLLGKYKKLHFEDGKFAIERHFKELNLTARVWKSHCT